MDAAPVPSPAKRVERRGLGRDQGDWGGTAMRTERPRRMHRIGVLFLIPFLAALHIVGFVPPSVSGDLPREIENPDASKTVRWTMGTDAGLTFDGVTLDSGNATLPWRPLNLSWDGPDRFLGNGSLDPNVAVTGTEISLRADSTNHVLDGGFATPFQWSFVGSPGGNLTAAWDGDNATARFRHASARTDTPWDGMDANLGNWSGVNGIAFVDTEDPHEGTGMLRLNFTLGSGPDAWAGVQRTGAVNWSGSDQLVLWVLPLDSSLPLSFEVSAFVGSTLYRTTARPLVSGWQEVAVDLTELGPSREGLVSLTLRVNGEDIPSGAVFFDDLRVGTAKRFDETARVWQTVVKPDATSPNPGSATLQLNWTALDAEGILEATGVVDVSGPSGSASRTFAVSETSGWRGFFADFSATMALPGLYNVSVGFRVTAKNTSESSVDARLDDVTILLPNRRNGTYLSNAVALGATSEFLRVTWTFEAPAATSLRAKIRSGNDSSPGSPAWSPWRTWSTAGSHPAGLPGAAFIQVQVDFETTNASATPSLRSLLVEARHHPLDPATIVSGLFRIPNADIASFLRWRGLQAKARTPAGTTIRFSIGDGTFWKTLGADGNISSTNWTTIQWSATLSTTDGLAAPVLEQVDLVYEYMGDPIRVQLRWPGWPGPISLRPGETVRFEARALDPGGHIVSREPARFDWSTDDDRAGQIGRDGSFVAGEGGDWKVTAALFGTGLSDTVTVHVTATWLDAMIQYTPRVLAVLAVGVLGYAGYQFGIRRLFQIDDVFLISKDGRLLMHNTRRIRADRDEDILSGMLTAILSFLKDADPEEDGELKRFEIGGKTTLLERGTNAYLVVVYSGRVPRWAGKDLRRFMANLESNFGDAFARWSGDPDDLRGLKEFTRQFVSRFRYRPPRRVNGRAA